MIYSAGDDVLFHTKSRDVKAVQYVVLRSMQTQSDVLVYGDIEFGSALTVWIGKSPRPAFSDCNRAVS